MTALDDLHHAVNCAALAAIDAALAGLGIPATVSDADLPALLPAIQVATEKAMRRHYEFLPEHFANHDDLSVAIVHIAGGRITP